MSETSAIRQTALKWLRPEEKGIDLGFGGDKIMPECIGFDLPFPYTKVGGDKQDGFGDARKLPYPNASFDWVYSSHLLEDYEETEDILKEWLRVLRVDGRMFLYLPIERKYKRHCQETGQNYNYAHKADFTVQKFMGIAEGVGAGVLAIKEHGPYSFYAVLYKKEVSPEKIVTGVHSGDLGDIVYAMPTMKQLGIQNLYINMRHPQKPTMLMPQDVAFIRPLLMAAGITTLIYDGEDPDWIMDNYRFNQEDTFATHLALAQAKAFNINIDLAQPYFDVEPLNEYKTQRPIVVNRSFRYHNGDFNWEYLLHGEPNVIFVGYEDEYEHFRKETGIDCEYRPVKNALEMARLIRAARVFIGNQSFAFALAEALKVNRIQEMCRWVPNVIPQSWNGLTVTNVKQLQRAKKWLTKLTHHSRLLS